jgi:NTE family protein
MKAADPWSYFKNVEKFPAKLGLSLSGGAARGAYQMGFWRAMLESGLSEQVKIITGASVGGINAALMLQNDWKKSMQLWLEAEPQDGFDHLREKPEQGVIGLLKDGIKNGGIRIDGLKKMLRECLDEEKIRQSPIDLGLVIYNLSQRKGEAWFKDQIPDHQLKEYIIGGASLPVFQRHQIGENKYIDGGIYKIMPIEMAFERHELDLLIGLDVAEASKFMPLLWRSKWRFGERLMYLRPSQSLPSPINFSRKARETQLDLGYQDGAKICGQLLKLPK